MSILVAAMCSLISFNFILILITFFFLGISVRHPPENRKLPLAPISNTSKVTGSWRHLPNRWNFAQHMFQSTSFCEFKKKKKNCECRDDNNGGEDWDSDADSVSDTDSVGESLLARQKWFGRWCHQHQHQHQNLDLAIVKINDVLPLNSWAGKQGTCVTEWLPGKVGKENPEDFSHPFAIFKPVQSVFFGLHWGFPFWLLARKLTRLCFIFPHFPFILASLC